MAKRKTNDFIASEDDQEEEEEAVESDAESSEEEKKPKSRKKIKTAAFDATSDDDEKPLKKTKAAREQKSSVKTVKGQKPQISAPKGTPKKTVQSASGVQTSSEGDKYLDLGKKRRATVRSFKGSSMLDIREFYEKDGKELPGKKGISLSVEQWAMLKDNTSAIDSMFEEVKK